MERGQDRVRNVYRIANDFDRVITIDSRNTNLQRDDKKQIKHRATMTNITHNGRIVHTVNSIESAYVWIATMNQMQRFMETEIRKYCVIVS